MIDRLTKIKGLLSHFLTTPKKWRGYICNQQEPYMDRLTMKWDDVGIKLHRIYPCSDPQQAYYHTHPTPIAVRILHGQYFMTRGTGHPNQEPPPESLPKIIGPLQTYELLNPHDWHRIWPVAAPGHSQITPVLSFMITEPRWLSDTPHITDNEKPQEMDEQQKADLLLVFQKIYPPSLEPLLLPG